MAFLLPSWFQKRALRYALSRLDFLETDDLDVDKLGISLGQRSVIELKDVGIQVAKLVERVPIPAPITIKSARVALLRLTIPADLIRSGIEVEITGIDVRVEVVDGSGQHQSQSQSPSKKDKANRPRIGSPQVHDPGGNEIPTTENLAKSFLLSEPAAERHEIEAAIGSKSQYLQNSVTSNHGQGEDDLGLGAPSGVSLPTFVADFFNGIVNRLSVMVNDIRVSLAFTSIQNDFSSNPVYLVFKLQALEVGSSELAAENNDGQLAKRTIDARGFEVLLVADSQLIHTSSRLSSPKLSRAPIHKSAGTSDLGEDFDNPPDAMGQKSRPLTSLHHSDESFPNAESRSSSPSSTVPFSFASPDDDSPKSEGSDGAYMDAQDSKQLAPRIATSATVDNRAHAEELVRLHSLQAPPSDGSDSSQPLRDDLTQSKVFTHDEAESMYMSAISGAVPEQQISREAMPGAWDSWDDPSASGSRSVETYSLNRAPHPLSVEAHSNETPSHTLHKAPPQVDGATNLFTRSQAEDLDTGQRNANLISKRLLLLTTLHVILPQVIDAVVPAQEPHASPPPVQHSSLPVTFDDNSASRLLESVIAPRPTSPTRRSPTAEASVFNREESDVFKIQAGELHAFLDLTTASMILQLSQMLPNWPERAENATVERVSPTPAISLNLNGIGLHLCESVPEMDTLLEIPDFHLKPFDDALLTLSLRNIVLQTRYDTMQRYQYISVHEMAMLNGSEKILSFTNNRDRSSKAPGISQHDVVVEVHNTANGQRVEAKLRPVLVTVNLIQVDEVLSRSGGLSSILDIGGSAFSTGTVRERPTAKSALRHAKSRTVRFEAAEPRKHVPENKTPSVLKINCHITGCTVDLIGTETSMQLKTSAMRAVYRGHVAGVQIDWLQLAGPSQTRAPEVSPLVVDLTNLSVRYLFSPEDKDLDRLLTILSPSKDRFDDDDDDLMIDTLLRQRRKGSVLRVDANDVHVESSGVDWQEDLQRLLSELGRLSSVTKYLPDDDRPGIMTLLSIKKVVVLADVDSLGTINCGAEFIDVAHVNVPALFGMRAMTVLLSRNEVETLITTLPNPADAAEPPPMIMCRFIADEMEPTVAVRLTNAAIEYRVSTVIAISEWLEHHHVADPERFNVPDVSSSSSESSTALARKVGVSVVAKDSMIGLSPHQQGAKGIFVLTDASCTTRPGRGDDFRVGLEIKKGSILIIDDEEMINAEASHTTEQRYFDESHLIQHLVKAGFVPVSNIAAASLQVEISHDSKTKQAFYDIGFRNNLFILETCADSTQTLVQILSNLSPPVPPSKEVKYRTEILPITDMLASFTGDAFATSSEPATARQAPPLNESRDLDADEEDDVDFKDFISTDFSRDDEDLERSYVDSTISESTLSGVVPFDRDELAASMRSSAHDSVMVHSMLDFQGDYFAQKDLPGGKPLQWNSSKDRYDQDTQINLGKPPLRVKVRDVHIIWNLFDGYDWQHTRDTISQAVRDIESKAASRRPRSNNRLSPRAEDEDESVIGDFLFNSIYIGVPAGKGLGDLTGAINQDIDDMRTETGSQATVTTARASPTRRQSAGRSRKPPLRLTRSRQHKMTFELKGVSADYSVLPRDSGEAQSSLDVRVKDLDIFDHLPTSTWKKFATYMHDAGEREIDTNMIHIEALNVKPVPTLPATEMLLNLTVLPLRLHVDQDALDFMARFFEFKDNRTPLPSSPSAPPFLQRVQVNPVRLKLDFKPKRVDYAGLRSGRTTEFMNFLVLDRADMVLRRVILHGVSGFDRAGIMLNNIWTPDVKRNQLPGVLKALAPIRPLVDVSTGLRQIVTIPIAEYRKDGRVVRSIQKGAIAFASTTAKELVNLGARLAIGTQTLLQGAEATFSPITATASDSPTTHDPDDQKLVSLYADQPLGIVQGLRGAWASLERDLLLARDAIIAVPGEVMASGSATDAAKVVASAAPTIILRPAIGASKAVGQTLMGVGNEMDRERRRRVEEVCPFSFPFKCLC